MNSSDDPHKSDINIKGHVFLMGDVHGKSAALMHSIENDINATMPHIHDGQDKNLILLGDVCMGLYLPITMQMLSAFERLTKDGWKVFIIRGNHDDPYFWKGSGGAAIPLQDNTIITINGKRVYIAGGGLSLDRSIRRQGKDYWPEEMLYVPAGVQRTAGKVDIILSHTGPTPPLRAYSSDKEAWKLRDPGLEEELERERIHIERLASLNPDYWIYGHFHHNCSFDYKGIRCCALDELCFTIDERVGMPTQSNTTEAYDDTQPESSWYYDKSKTQVQERPQRPDGHMDIFVPFVGLYEALDDLIENQAFEYEKEALQEEKNVAKIIGKFNLHKFCRDSVHVFSELFSLKTLEFAYLLSPKDYSMESDHLCCTISKEEFFKLYKGMSDGQRSIYNALVECICTARPGYEPYRIFCPAVPSLFEFDSEDAIPEDRPAVAGVLMTMLAAEDENDYRLDGTYNECGFWYKHLDPRYVNENLDVEVIYSQSAQTSEQTK